MNVKEFNNITKCMRYSIVVNVVIICIYYSFGNLNQNILDFYDFHCKLQTGKIAQPQKLPFSYILPSMHTKRLIGA